MLRQLGRHVLHAHPVTPTGTIQGLVEELSVDVARQDDQLVLRYRLSADLESLRLPGPGAATRTDGLWRQTCFEAFIAQGDSGAYREYNFSPSGAWASYRFTGYRAGMTPLTEGAAPRVQARTTQDELEVEAAVDLSGLAASALDQGLRLGLFAVIEDRARVLSYWALAHPLAKPDFHHADGFVIDLD